MPPVASCFAICGFLLSVYATCLEILHPAFVIESHCSLELEAALRWMDEEMIRQTPSGDAACGGALLQNGPM